MVPASSLDNPHTNYVKSFVPKLKNSEISASLSDIKHALGVSIIVPTLYYTSIFFIVFNL